MLLSILFGFLFKATSMKAFVLYEAYPFDSNIVILELTLATLSLLASHLKNITKEVWQGVVIPSLSFFTFTTLCLGIKNFPAPYHWKKKMLMYRTFNWRVIGELDSYLITPCYFWRRYSLKWTLHENPRSAYVWTLPSPKKKLLNSS